MFMDADLLFSDAQAVTAAAASDNYIDLGPLYSGNTTRDIGVSDELYVVVSCDVAMTDGSSNSTLAVTWGTDDNTSFSSETTLFTIGTFPAVSAAGAKLIAKLPPGLSYERYNRLTYTPANGDLTTGSFTAAIVKNIDNYKSYVSAVSTGI